MSIDLPSTLAPAAPPHPLIPPALAHFDALPDSAYVSLVVVCTLFGCSPATVWRRVRSGQLVSPTRIGSRTTRWKVADLRHTLGTMDQAGGNHHAK